MQSQKKIKKAHKKPSNKKNQSRYKQPKKKSRFTRRQRRHFQLAAGGVVLLFILALLVHLLFPSQPAPTTKKTVDTSQYPHVTICIDAGHGGYDGGNVGVNGSIEKDYTIQYAKYFGKYLKAMNPNIRLVYTREDDNVSWDSNEDSDLKARVKIANEAKADYFISFHLNSSEQNPKLDDYGFFYRGNDQVSYDIAQSIAKNLKQAGWNYNYTMTDVATYPLYVISDQKERPSLLFEVGYSSNTKQEKAITNTKNIKKIAKASAKAYHNYILKHNK